MFITTVQSCHVTKILVLYSMLVCLMMHCNILIFRFVWLLANTIITPLVNSVPGYEYSGVLYLTIQLFSQECLDKAYSKALEYISFLRMPLALLLTFS